MEEQGLHPEQLCYTVRQQPGMKQWHVGKMNSDQSLCYTFNLLAKHDLEFADVFPSA